MKTLHLTIKASNREALIDLVHCVEYELVCGKNCGSGRSGRQPHILGPARKGVKFEYYWGFFDLQDDQPFSDQEEE
jgi:hypothetical protein